VQDNHVTINREKVLEALNLLADPVSGKGLVDAGIVQGLSLRDDRAGFMIEAPGDKVADYGPVREAAEKALLSVPGVKKAQVVLTSNESPPGLGVTRVRRGASIAPDPKAAVRPPETAETPDHVGRVIAVASGKGGVGKSTVAVNLALAMARAGHSVGLLDADVYGPSIPTMLGLSDQPAFADGKLQPLAAHGLKLMSIGFIVDEGAPMIWRGPMASSALRQMIHDVNWASAEEPLDILVVDLPPGTGDVQLTLVQKLNLDGVVIVSTPNELALIDARRATAMFERTATPILGMIENMAYFEDASGAQIPIFGRGGAAGEARAMGVPLLAEIPIDVALRQASDTGTPLSEGPTAEAFDRAAAVLMGQAEDKK
jgi:ATP-binding protein involved in chromosome partitioning